MCYLNQVKHCKTKSNALLELNKTQNTTSVLCLLTHVKQNANNAMHLLNRNTQTINAFFFHQSSALSVICYLNQVKY